MPNESYINTDCTAQCLIDSDNSIHNIMVRYMKSKILKRDFNQLISTSLSQHTSVKLVAAIAESSSWRCLWDIALDKGVKGTSAMQFLFGNSVDQDFGTDCVRCATFRYVLKRIVLNMTVNNI